MNAKLCNKILATTLSLIFVATSSQVLYGYQTIPSSNPGPLNPSETVQQTPAELQALVAPIALYPDALVAQILSAATFPDEVAIANLLDGTKHESDGQRSDAGGRHAILGSQRESTHTISDGAG